MSIRNRDVASDETSAGLLLSSRHKKLLNKFSQADLWKHYNAWKQSTVIDFYDWLDRA